MYKKEQVVMLPTDEKAPIKLGLNNLMIFDNYRNTSICNKNNDFINQHLYITSDDELKKGDFAIYDNGHNSPGFVVKKVEVSDGIVYRRPNETYQDYGYKDGGITPLSKDVKKIIATTDSFLTYHDKIPIGENVCGLHKQIPQIPQQFIEHFVSEYNKGNIITDVMVEFTSYHGINTSIAEINAISGDNSMNWKGIGDNRDFKLKLNQDNTINIKPVKDSWSREEVKNLVLQLSKCRDTINSLSTLHGYSKAELEKENDTLVFKDNKHFVKD